MNGPAKVCNFEVAPEVQQEVLWLNVTVNDLLGVAVPGGRVGLG